MSGGRLTRGQLQLSRSIISTIRGLKYIIKIYQIILVHLNNDFFKRRVNWGGGTWNILSALLLGTRGLLLTPNGNTHVNDI